jgi:hypothetical protein
MTGPDREREGGGHMENGSAPEPQDDEGGPYGVFGEGRPRRIVGDSDEPPRRRPRKKPGAADAPAGAPDDPADR